ncbi:hypothetical protein [Streptomyces hokutonensis]|uniref:Uncharacterized protein n=1 Tax=Streptomyces hokutonensis TaxID=1306990 RepID=A0ABW6MEG2_9ACTN
MTDTMPPLPDTPPLPAQPPAPPRRSLGAPAAGLLRLAAGAGLMGAVWGITATTGAGPGTFTLEGAFALTEDASTVYGADADVIATGHLGDSNSPSYGTCTFDVSVPDVPKGEKFYKVEVSHRGTLQLTAKEAENGEFAGTLG